MVLSACYNEAFYGPDFVRDFLARVWAILFEELRIDEMRTRHVNFDSGTTRRYGYSISC